MERKSWRRGVAEVVLIATGVLLGLAADEWRQGVARARQEAGLLTELRAEFLANHDELVGVGRSTERYRDAALFLLDPDSVEGAARPDVLATIRLVLSQGSRFTPQTGTLMSYLADADPNLISDTELRAALADWPRRVADLDLQETRASDFIHGDARDFIVERGDLLTLMATRGNAPGRDPDPTTLAIRGLVADGPTFDWISLTQSQQFRNLAATRLRLAMGVLSKHEEVLEAHVRVLELLEIELGDREGSL